MLQIVVNIVTCLAMSMLDYFFQLPTPPSAPQKKQKRAVLWSNIQGVGDLGEELLV